MKIIKKKILLSWSSGKDAAWALYKLQKDPDIDLKGLFCTVNSKFDRVAMHAVRVELLKMQAKSIGLPLEIIELPYPCDNDNYEKIMNKFVEKAKIDDIECFAFGDLFLENIRKYREDNLKDTGIKPIFPLWNIPTDKLSKHMIEKGLKTIITCIDPKQISKEFVGTQYNLDFLSKLPEGVDPCGENGEFHSFVFDGPMFKYPIDVELVEVVVRDGFYFADINIKNLK